MAEGNTTSTNQQVQYFTGNPADWPKEQDAVVSAPGNHRILLENESVRVPGVTFGPREPAPVHHHQWPIVFYIHTAGDFIGLEGAGNVIMDTRKLPAPLKGPLTMYKEPKLCTGSKIGACALRHK